MTTSILNYSECITKSEKTFIYRMTHSWSWWTGRSSFSWLSTISWESTFTWWSSCSYGSSLSLKIQYKCKKLFIWHSDLKAKYCYQTKWYNLKPSEMSEHTDFRDEFAKIHMIKQNLCNQCICHDYIPLKLFHYLE